MSAIDFARVRRLVEQVHDLSPEERSRFLEGECGDDRALRDEVEALLRSAATASDFLAPDSAMPALERLVPPELELCEANRVGGFRLVRRVAAGGMGTIWEAEQDEPRRKVALKTLRFGGGSRDAVRRFRHEAEILARLRHPHVAQIYASGVHRARGGAELPWYALEYVEDARTLLDFSRERALEIDPRLKLFAQLCDAVQHGHERGVIHRDLKPSNVLVDARGVLKVIDFGVARMRDGGAAAFETETGRVMGTLPYMSPEQLSGASDGIDVRSDVYALGVVLYELLTFDLPFDFSRTPLVEAARITSEVSPRPPSSNVVGLSRDLDAIVLKALEKDRERRYASAAELGADVERYLHGEPVEARAPSVTYNLRVFARRYRALLSTLAIVLVVLFAAAVVSLAFALRARTAERQARDSAAEAIAQRDAARFREYTAEVAAAYAAIRGGDAASARQHLGRAPESMRGFEWWYLARSVDRSLWTRAVECVDVLELAWHPDGTRIFAATHQGAVEVRDSVSGQRLERLPGRAATFGGWSSSPDGSLLAETFGDGLVRLVETAPLREVARWQAHVGAAVGVVFSHDGRTLFTSGARGEVKQWSVTERALVRDLEKSPGTPFRLSLSADERWIAGGTAVPSEVLVWDLQSGALRWRLDGHEAYVSSAIFLADGQTVASASHDHTIRFWDLCTGDCRAVLRGHADLIWNLALDPAGGRLASASWDRTVRLWSVADGRPLAQLVGHAGNVSCVAFSPDGRRLVSGDDSAHLKLWDVERADPEVTTVRGKWIWTMRFWPDSSSLLAIHGGYADRRESGSGRALANYPATRAEWRCGAPSPDGATVALGDTKAFVALWSADGTTERARFRVGDATLRALDWNRDGRRIALAGEDGSLRVVDPTGAVLRELPNCGAANLAVAWHPDGARLASAGARGDLRIYDVDSGTLVFDGSPLFARVNALAWSHDGDRIAMALDDGRVSLWDVAGRRLERELFGHQASVQDVAFSPDGLRLASCGNDRSVRLWELPTGREVATFVDHTHFVDALAFSPDGSLLASASSDSTLRWYDAGGGAEHSVANLAERNFLARDVRAALASDGALPPAQRARALALADRIADDPLELAREAWAIARWPGSDPESLARARDLARAANTYAPGELAPLRALAAAHLRSGDPRAALEVLENAPRLERPDALLDVLRTIALTRLGRGDEARERLAQVPTPESFTDEPPPPELRRLRDEAKTALGAR
jgi:WD40 repeat protein